MAYNLESILKFKDQSRRGRKQAEGGFKDLEKTVKRVGLAMVTAFGVQQVTQMAKVGAQAERVEKRFAAFAQSAGGAEAVLDSFQKGAGGAASKMEAMQSASTLLQMGLAGNASEMEKLVTMATRLGDQTQSVTDRVSNFSLLLANQSLPRLDSFGISSGKVRARIAELQASVEGMTRETAFMQAVMEEGEKSLGVLGERTEDNLTSFEQLEARMSDLKVEIGQALLPVITLLIGGFADLLESAKPALDVLKEFTTTIAAMPKPAEAAAAGLEQVREVTASWVEEGIEAADMASTLAERVNKAGEEVGRLGGRIKLSAGDYKDLGNSIRDGVNAALRESSRSYNEYLQLTDEFNAKVEVAEWRVNALTKAQYNNYIEAVKLNVAIAERAERYDVANKAALKSGEIAARNLRMDRQREDSLKAATDQLNLLRGEEDQYNAIREESIERNDMLSASYDLTAYGIERQAQATGEAAGAVRTLTSAQADAIVQSRLLAEQQVALTEKTAGQAKEFGNLAISLKDATEKEIAQNLIRMLDPIRETDPATYVAGLTEIGTSFGLMDEQSIALAKVLPDLAQAMADGVVPAQDWDAVLKDVVADSADGNVNLNEHLSLYRQLPEPVGQTAEQTGLFGEKLDTASPLIDTVTGDLGALSSNAYTTRDSMEAARERTDAFKQILENVEGDHYVDVHIRYHEERRPTLPGEFQYGGVVPGPIGQRRRITAHGGEIVLNPFQPGALGGPTDNRQYHDSTVNNIYNPLAAAMAMAQKRNRRRARFEARM